MTLPPVTPEREGKFDTRPLKFSARAEMVLVPVVVTKNGKHVAGLTKSDFSVFENGAQQKIASVEEFVPQPGRLAPFATAPGVFTNRLQGADRPRSLTIVAIDAVNIPVTEQTRVRRELARWLADYVDNSHLVELVIMHSGGIRTINTFTDDPKALAAALQKARSEFDVVQASGELPTADAGVSGPMSNASGSAGDQVSAFLTPSADESFRQAAAIDATLQGFQYIARAFEGIPGRKSLVWVTAGFPLLLDGETGGVLSGASITYEYVVKLLNDASIAVYPIDARGLVANGVPASVGSSTLGRASGGTAAATRGYIAQQQNVNADLINTFQFFANSTGGRAFYNRNDIGNEAKEASDEGSSYYMLGYYLDKNNKKPGWRKLNVKVASEGVTVHSRHGLYVTRIATDPSTSRTMDLSLAVHSPLDYTAIPMNVSVKQPVMAGKVRKVSFTVSLPPGASTVDDSDRNRIDIDFAASAQLANGEQKDQLLETLNMQLKPEQLQQVTSTGITYQNTLELPPGNYMVRFVVRDNFTGRMGSVLAPLNLN
jgi:VWFA-related protein